VLVAVAALAAGAGAYVYQQRTGRTLTPQAATPGDRGPERGARLAAAVPDVSLADRAGQMRSLHEWAGKSLIVNFWATWCAPCRNEIPLLQKLQREHAAEGFQVVGIAADFRDKVIPFADGMKIEYPVLIGEQEALDAAKAFGVEAFGFPFTIFADARGRIVAAHMGELTQPEADLILGAVQAVNAGRQSLDGARATIESGMPALKHAARGS